MAQAIKLNDGNYWDSTGIVHNKQLLRDILDGDKTELKNLSATDITVSSSETSHHFNAKKTGNTVQVRCCGRNHLSWDDWTELNSVAHELNGLPTEWRKGIYKSGYPLYCGGLFVGNLFVSTSDDWEILKIWVRLNGTSIEANSEVNFVFTWIVDD